MIVHAVLPNDIDSPLAPSGGNAYDRAVLDGLRALGWSVVEHAVRGSWPEPSAADLAGLRAVFDRGGLFLADGLVGCAAPPPDGRVVMLVHMPLRRPSERSALAASRAVIATSRAAAAQLRALYGVSAVVAPPGVAPAALAAPSPSGRRLLCVAAVTRQKGYEVLAAALDAVPEPFALTWVGHTREDGALPPHPRITLTGPLVGAELSAAYARADLLVVASLAETYGMVVTEALARGIPVVGTDVVAEALGFAPDGTRPGLLVPPGDAPALAAALRRWLTEPDLRTSLRAAAAARRATLPDWAETARQVAAVLEAA